MAFVFSEGFDAYSGTEDLPERWSKTLEVLAQAPPAAPGPFTVRVTGGVSGTYISRPIVEGERIHLTVWRDGDCLRVDHGVEIIK
jgi:hypothetical protein